MRPQITRYRDRSPLTNALVVFMGLALAALLIWLTTAALGGATILADPAGWVGTLDERGALDAVGSSAEVVAAVLGIAITVVAIVVELAANRYTPKITNLFVRHPTNAIVMGFFVLTTILCVWVSSTLGRVVPEGALFPYASLALCMTMVTLCLLTLLPYFAFVFSFLSPRNIVRRIQNQAIRSFERARLRRRQAQHEEAIEAIEELVDIGRSARDHSDLGIAMESVNALRDLVLAYEELCAGVCDEQFDIAGILTHDSDFVSLESAALDELIDQGGWLQVTVLGR